MRALTTLISVACALIVGCAGTTQGQQESQKLSSQVENFGKVAQAAELELRTSLTTLKGMIDSEGGDLKAPYNSYKSSVAKCGKHVSDLKQRIANMDAAAATYFDTYEGDLEKITSEDLRATRGKRLEGMRANYQALSQHANGITTAFEPILMALNDISTALGLELNASSVRDLKSNSDALEKLAMDFYKRIGEIDADVKKWMAETAPMIEESGETKTEGGEAAKS